MSKQRTDTGGVRGFVRRMFGRPSPAAGGATPEQANEVLQLLLKLLRRRLEAQSDRDTDANQALCRTILAETILPKIINSPPTKADTEQDLVNHKEAKDWAFACANVLGFIAGLSLQSEAIGPALKEAMRVAETCAKQTSEAISQTIVPALNGKAPAPRKKSVKEDPTPARANKATKTSAPMLEQKRKMIEDLESEAITEDARGNTAAAAALRAFAAMKKKEVEIEEDLNKTGKSAA